jgi:hypothetical protein
MGTATATAAVLMISPFGSLALRFFEFQPPLSIMLNDK